MQGGAVVAVVAERRRAGVRAAATRRPTAGAWAWAWAAAVAAAVNPARAAGRWRWLRSGSDLQPTLVTRTAQGTAILAQAGTTVAGFEWPRAHFESATMDASLHGGTERRIVETTASWMAQAVHESAGGQPVQCAGYGARQRGGACGTGSRVYAGARAQRAPTNNKDSPTRPASERERVG